VVASLGVTDGVDLPAGLVNAPAPRHWERMTRRVDAFLEHVGPR